MRFAFAQLFLLFALFSKGQHLENLNFEKLDSGFVFKGTDLYLPATKLGIYNEKEFVKTDTFPIWLSESEQKKFHGVYWLKNIFRVDSSCKNKSLTLNFKIDGACEIYLNRKLVKKIGLVGYNEVSQVELSSDYFNYTHVFEPDKNYEILIRGSENEPAIDHEKNRMLLDMEVSIFRTEQYHEIKDNEENTVIGISGFLFGFYFILFVIHFSIYYLNRYEKSNLYYSIILFFASYIVLSRLVTHYSNNYFLINTMEQLSAPVAVTLFHFMPFMFRAIFRFDRPKWYAISYLVLFITYYLGFNEKPFANQLSISIIFFGTIESSRVIILALKQKKEGAKAIAFGILGLAIIMAISLVFIILGKSSVKVVHPIFGFMILILMLFSLTGVPLSLTFYLANSISRTNKFLSKKLIEVEDLSKKSLEQEKEKQEILSQQNVTLERQVAERTFEISEQKKIIEEKNKDIIDSINYAKQIQTSILPERAFIKELLPNSFVFYNPKDIVSGDFYYVTEIKGSKIIVAADCTGHGVPGALMSMVGSNIINKLTHENGITNPKDLVENLHKELRHSLKQDQPGSLNRDGMDLAAITIGKKEILYSGANRSLIWFDQKNELHEIKPDKTPVGGSHIDKIELTEHHLNIKEIKQLFLYSDGFADQFGGPDLKHGGKKIMVSRFKQWLSEIVDLDSTAQENILSEKFQDWKGKNEQVDDVMVIGIKP